MHTKRIELGFFGRDFQVMGMTVEDYIQHAKAEHSSEVNEEKQMKKSGMRKNFREGKSGKKSNMSVGSKMSSSLKINDNTSVSPVIDSKESTISR